MSISSTSVVHERIKAATSKSPIAVFKTDTPWKFEAMFANTKLTNELVSTNPPNLIGVFAGHSGAEDFAEKVVRVRHD